MHPFLICINKYWVGPKVLSCFFINFMRKIQMNFLANSVYLFVLSDGGRCISYCRTYLFLIHIRKILQNSSVYCTFKKIYNFIKT